MIDTFSRSSFETPIQGEKGGTNKKKTKTNSSVHKNDCFESKVFNQNSGPRQVGLVEIKFSLGEVGHTERIKVKNLPLQIGAFKRSQNETLAQENTFQTERAPFHI